VAVTAYDVFHDGQLIKSVAGDTLSTSFAVVQNVTWGLYVNARDAAGNVSQASATVPITPPPCHGDHEPPTAPGNLKRTARGTSAALSWSASADNVGVTAYDVFRSGALAGSVAGTPPGTTFNDAGLAPNTTFDYFVVARDGQGNTSPDSNTLPITTGSGCSNP